MSVSGSRAPAADTGSAKWGLKIQSGQVSYPANQTVLARNLDGNQVIAKVHIRIDDTFVLLFPDGQLATQPVANTFSTPNPFIAIFIVFPNLLIINFFLFFQLSFHQLY